MEDDRVQACVCLRGRPLLAVTRDRARTNRAPGRGTHLGVKVFPVCGVTRGRNCVPIAAFFPCYVSWKGTVQALWPL